MPSTEYLNRAQDLAFQEAMAAAISRGKERKVPDAKPVDYDDGRVRRHGNGG